jgi:predicted ArsR family transcriptional regulator
MPKKGHTEEQIIAALKQYESGDKATDICRKLGISQATVRKNANRLFSACALASL